MYRDVVLYDLFVLDYNWKLFDSVMVKRELIKEHWIFPLLSTKLNWQLKKKQRPKNEFATLCFYIVLCIWKCRHNSLFSEWCFNGV